MKIGVDCGGVLTDMSAYICRYGEMYFRRKHAVDLMIDDKPDVAIHLANHGIRVLLFDTPYNQGTKNPAMLDISRRAYYHRSIFKAIQGNTGLTDAEIAKLAGCRADAANVRKVLGERQGYAYRSL